MKKIRKYFGEYEMTWARVLLLAVITGAYTAVVKLIPFFDETSIQDIAVYLDWWFLFAVFVVVNCKTWWEASLKCFVFFLVSQPLIYLIQVPFYDYGWAIFRYYPRWFVFTLLTLPGAAVAFLVKKKNWLSVAVLSVATGFLTYSSVNYLSFAVNDFPHHLLSGICSLALAVFFVFVLLDGKKHRAAALGVMAAVLIAAGAALFAPAKDNAAVLELGEGNWKCTVEDETVAAAVITDGNHVTVTAGENGNTFIIFENEAGEEQTWAVSVSGNGSLWVSTVD